MTAIHDFNTVRPILSGQTTFDRFKPSSADKTKRVKLLDLWKQETKGKTILTSQKTTNQENWQQRIITEYWKGE